MLYWGNRRVSPDGIGTRHITYGIKRVWKGSFQDHNVPYIGYIMRGSHWGWLHLRAAENGPGNAGRGAFATVGHLMVFEAGKLGVWGDCKVLESIELTTLTSRLLLMALEWLEVNASSPWREVVFLMPWWLAGVLLCVWDPSILLIGSWKVTFSAVFLLPLGGVGIATWSMEWVASKLGTWKVKNTQTSLK